MNLTGIGVLLIGIALLVLAIFIAKVLHNFAGVLKGIDQTVEKLPEQLDGMLMETSHLIQTSNDTLSDVNEKLGTLNPLFHIVGDVGETTRKLSSSVVDATHSVKRKVDEADPYKKNKSLGGLYGTAALSLYAIRKKKEMKQPGGMRKQNSMIVAGQERAFDIDRMKEEAKEAAREGKYVNEDAKV